MLEETLLVVTALAAGFSQANLLNERRRDSARGGAMSTLVPTSKVTSAVDYRSTRCSPCSHAVDAVNMPAR